jgi:hypothetical protein
MFLSIFTIKTQPGDVRWARVLKKVNYKDLKLIDINKNWNVPSGILAMLISCVLIYGCPVCCGILDLWTIQAREYSLHIRHTLLLPFI